MYLVGGSEEKESQSYDMRESCQAVHEVPLPRLLRHPGNEPQKPGGIHRHAGRGYRDGLLALRDLQAVFIGPVRQEILSGISDDEKFVKLKKILSCLPDAPIETMDYELAAQYSNICRRSGIQGSAVDFLICAVAVRNNFIIYTVDKDFEHYRVVLPIALWVEKI